MTFKDTVRAAIRNLGYDIARHPRVPDPLVLNKRRLMASYAINVVIDVGANTGQFAHTLRKQIGYTGRIVSFEPMRMAFSALKDFATADRNWQVFNYALGDADGQQTINMAGNSLSSSILDMLPSHAQAAPGSRYVGTEQIVIRKLDSIFHELCEEGDRVYLKIDTQGFESKVISGADTSIHRIGTIQLEMSLVPLYQGELLFLDLLELLTGKGYALVGLEPGFADPQSGELLQVDGIFHRPMDNGR